MIRKTRLASESDGAIVGALLGGVTLRSLKLPERKYAVHVQVAGTLRLLLAEVPAARKHYQRLRRKNKGAGPKLRNFLSRIKFICLRLTSVLSETPAACVSELPEDERKILEESSKQLKAEFAGVSFSHGASPSSRPVMTDEQKLKRALKKAKALTETEQSKYHRLNASISDLESQVQAEPEARLGPEQILRQNPALTLPPFAAVANHRQTP